MTAPALPTISVVVPSYNQGRFLGEALDSIFRQGYPRLEVVVMDGGSTDDSVDVIRAHAHRLRYWQSQRDGGQSAAINAGMRHCTGDIVAWLNSDDLYWNDALWTVGRAWAANPGFGLYAGNGLRLEQRTGTYLPFNPRHMALTRSALTLTTFCLQQPSSFFLREAWEAVGGLNESLNYVMDWDLIIRLTGRYPAVVVQEYLSVAREYDETKTRAGLMARAAEIVRMTGGHTGRMLTAGGLHYLLETLLATDEVAGRPETEPHVRAAYHAGAVALNETVGNGLCFPETNDAQNRDYIQLADPVAQPAHPAGAPAVGLVVPAGDDPAAVERTLRSIADQAYPRVSVIVTPADHSPAHALNRALERVEGDVLGWLRPGDRLTAGALAHAARAFAEEPGVGWVWGHAVTTDGDRLALYNCGPYRSALWSGDGVEPVRAAFWMHAPPVAPATVLFRRAALAAAGPLDERLSHAHEVEFHLRLGAAARGQNLRRTQALCDLYDGEVVPDLPRYREELARLLHPAPPAPPSAAAARFGSLKGLLRSVGLRRPRWQTR